MTQQGPRRLRITGLQLPPSFTPEIEPVQPDTQQIQDAAQQTAIDNFEESIRTVTSSNRANAQLLNNIAQNVIGVEQAVTLREQFNNARQSGDAGRIQEFVNTAFNVFQNVQQVRSEIQEQRDAQARQAALVQLEQEKQQLLVNAESIIRDPDRGRAAYQRQLSEMITRFGPVIGADEAINLTAELYTPLRSLVSEEAQARHGTFQQINDSQRNVAIETLELKYTSQLHQLRNSRTIEDSQDLANNIIDQLNTDLAQLRPLDAAIVAESLLAEINENFGTAVGNISEVSAALLNFQEYAVAAQQVQNQFAQDGDIIGAQIRENQLRILHGISGETALSDPLQPQIQLNRSMRLGREFSELQRAGLIEAGRQLQFDEAETLTLAYEFFINPTSIGRFTSIEGFDQNPNITQAIEIAGALTEYEQLRTEVGLEVNNIQLRINQLDVQNRQQVLSLLLGNQRDSVLESLGIAAQFNSGLNSLLEQAQSARDPAQVEAAAQAIFDARATIASTLQRRAQLQQERLDPSLRVLMRYEIDSPDRLQQLAEGAGVTIQAIQAEIEQTRREALQNIGTLPNFNIPQLSTMVSPGGIEVLVPFRTGQSFPVTGVLDDPREGGARRHAGVDFGVPIGTDILFYTQGTVVNISNDTGGYGRYVDIRSPDGFIHRFADVNDILVSEGQQVYPGEVIALSGNSGNGSAHLHWEIQMDDGSPFGRDGAVDPFEYMAQFSHSPPQVRNGGVSPPGTMYLGNNQYLLQDGTVFDGDTGEVRQGGFSGRNPVRRNFASVNSSDYVNRASSNYGYSQLASDDSFRTRLHQVASNVGVPTQWLADVIAFETGGTFSASQWNLGGAPAVGLIQFYDETGRGRAGGKTLGGRFHNLQDIARMSRTQQLSLVETYLRDNAPQGGYRTPYELLVGIFFGGGALNDFRRDPQRFANQGDGYINLRNYSRQLGSHAGRQYEPLYGGTRTHTRVTRGCPTCQAMLSNNQFFPHEATP